MTTGINRAVMELNAAGALTSATLMANGAAFRDAVHAAFVQTTLDTGCHVVLVDGSPILPHTQIPTLANAEGFRPTLGSFLGDLQRGRIAPEHIEAEAVAQIQKIQSAGLTVSHVDTHKHTHMFARVLRPLLRAASCCEVRAIRNPFEPAWSVGATVATNWQRRVQVVLLRTQRRGFLRAVRMAGMLTTDGAIGVLATGELSASILRQLIDAMPQGTWELVCHPGYQDHALAGINTRLQESREIERAALAEVFADGIKPSIVQSSFATITAAPGSIPGSASSYARD